ncbi:recombinase family protein [Humidesulfovibrio idahonensis]
MKGDSYRRQYEGTREYALEHGLDLDESLVFEDLGVSAFKGKHVKIGALSRFLEAVHAGTIRPGSTLIIENLDRFSREDVLTAFSHLSSLLAQGVAVVTLQDGRVFTRERMTEDMSLLLLSLFSMQRAHEESAVKSARLSKAWEHKREDAREQGKAMTSTCPQWLKLDKETGKYLIIEDRADTVRRIFRETLEGKGANAIVQLFNTEEVHPFGRSKGWWESYVKKILANEAVFGRLQPHTTKAEGGRRVPVGEPVEDYYPAIVDKETFYRAQTMRQERRIPGGRTVAKFSNLFTGLVKCGVCGATMAFDNKGRGPKGGTYLVCAEAKRRLGTCVRHAWRYPLAQTHILLNLHSLDYRNLLPDIARQAQDEAQTLERQLEAMRSELAETVGKVDNLADQIAESPSQALRRALDRVEARQLELEASLESMTSQLEGARGRSFEAEAVADESEEAFKAFIAAEQEGEPGQVYEMRRRMHQILLRQLETIKFYPAHSPESSLHGIIEISFKGTGRIHRIKVDKGQASSKGYQVLEDGTEELHINEPNAVWPPDGIFINGRALAAELGLDF